MDSAIGRRPRMRRWIIWHSYFLLSGLLLMLWQLQAQALRVAISAEDYPPFYYQQGDTLSGFSVEVLQAVANELGLTLQWQRLPWNRVVQQVASGKADVITVLYKTDTRATQFYYSAQSYLRDAIVLLCAQPCPHQFDGNLTSLLAQPVAVVRGFSYGELLDKAEFSKTAVVESDPMMFKLLLSRRLQLGIASLLTIQHAADLKQAVDKIAVLHPPLDFVDIYFAFSRQSAVTPELVSRFDRELGQFKSSAAYSALLQRYKLN